MHVCLAGLYPCTFSHSTHARFTGPSLCILKTLTSWANTPLWRHGGVLSVQIESKIKPLVQEEAKNSFADMRYEGMWLFTCGGDVFGPEAFERHTYETKTEAESC